jgi:predicted DNA-binding protein (UPF0251 family)
LLTDEGTPYWRATESGNRCQDIPNMWNRLLARVRKDFPDFRKLPFNSLRDTSANMIRQQFGGEIASLQLAHKHQTDDGNLNNYTNPMRKKHARAVRWLEAKMAVMFLSVGEPFPESQPRVSLDGGGNITVAQKQAIRRYAAQGFKRKKIAELVGVSTVTVWRHLGAKKKAK